LRPRAKPSLALNTVHNTQAWNFILDAINGAFTAVKKEKKATFNNIADQGIRRTVERTVAY